ncbi:MAG: MmcQ/YjbR family DNA-binding protein [Clostridium sp.]|nr:MmcQ/YjbR family DNA-binding protein [Clostridium sp.]MCM1444309.1 MmcQ/YjbR family DNA-binding protein [Candidatus Amulumruptor caecigallinarius]
MNIESKVFKRYGVDINKLLEYGFTKIDNKYIYSKNIMNDSFRVDLCIEENNVIGKIYDLNDDFEYTNFRVESQNGEFVNSIRLEYEKLLVDIRDNCFNKKYFTTNQANEITNIIIDKYKDAPEFLWKKSPEGAVFRNPSNGKWYGLIMEIDKSKIDSGNGKVEILNVKLPQDKIKELLNKNGFYKAYHMNKNNWITIILDEKVETKEIVSYIEISHKYTEK